MPPGTLNWNQLVEEFGAGVNANILRIRMCTLRKLDGPTSKAKSSKEIGTLSPKSGRITKSISSSTMAKLDSPKKLQMKVVELETLDEVKIKAEGVEV
jgi:hypothetical protein